MSTKQIIEQVFKYLEPVITENNFELFDVELVKEGPNWYLRIFVDKEDGITINDCELVSRYIEKILDEKDPIPQAYILEVSSPGIDRPLKKDADYEKYKGKAIDVKLYKSIDKKKELQGTLVGLQDGIVTIVDHKGKEININKSDIATAKLAIIF